VVTNSNNGKLTNFLLSCLTIGFVAWAGVVWNASESVTDSVNIILRKLGVIEEKLNHATRDLDEHEQLPYHGDVGIELERLKRGR